MILILIFGVISTIFAVRPKVALWGLGSRYEGIFTIMYYFSIMFLSSFISGKYKKAIVASILLSGVIQCIYAVCQINEVEGVFRMVHSTGKIIFLADGFKLEQKIWATGFLTNPNFFGTYMLLCTSYALGLYIDEKKIIKSIIYILIMGLFIVGILISNTTSCAIGLIAVLIFSLIFCIKNKKVKKIIFLTLAIICTVLCVYKAGKTNLIKDVGIVGKESTEIAKGNIKEEYGTNRIYIWKNTLSIVPKNLVHGVGIDNFYYAFDGKALVTKDGKTYFDKAYNEYLQILITEGIFCLVTYIAMYATIGIRGVVSSYKRRKHNY